MRWSLIVLAEIARKYRRRIEIAKVLFQNLKEFFLLVAFLFLTTMAYRIYQIALKT